MFLSRIGALLLSLFMSLTLPLTAQSAPPPAAVFGQTASGALSVDLNGRQLLIDGRRWAGTNWPVVSKALAAVMQELDAGLGTPRTTPVHLYHASFAGRSVNYPMTVEKNGHTEIYLATGQNYWSQFVYQFAHEYLHYAAGRHFHAADRFGWFEETLGELAALYALERLADAGFQDDRLTNYQHHFAGYAHQVLERNELRQTTAPWEFLPAWLDDLGRERYDRPRNRAVAERLLPAFRKDPTLWAAVPYLRHIEEDACPDFTAYVDRWLALLPVELRERVAGLELTRAVEAPVLR